MTTYVMNNLQGRCSFYLQGKWRKLSSDLRGRASTVEKVRTLISGGTYSDIQVQEIAELRRKSREKRQKLAKEVL